MPSSLLKRFAWNTEQAQAPQKFATHHTNAWSSFDMNSYLDQPGFADDSNSSTQPLSVSELTHQIKDLLEISFPAVAVMGEISSMSRPRSGHVYLTLKDENSQIQGAMWRNRADRLKFDLEDGLKVIATGRVEVYAPRGSYQLIIDQLVPEGIGPLELAFRQLQEKLSAEGLFDPERKRPLPPMPRRIALVTSPQGAALRDMLQVFARKWPLAEFVVVPVSVQGDHAAGEIVEGLQLAGSQLDCDLIITGRGGGSLEDLWPFNEERVARAVAACPIPVISAVGHEIDVTICDLVADHRALTPTEAAETCVPDRDEWLSTLIRTGRQMHSQLSQNIERSQSLIQELANKPMFRSPEMLLKGPNRELQDYAGRLTRAIKAPVQRGESKVAELAGMIHALSPLKVLSRGYTVTTLSDSQKTLTSIQQLAENDEGTQSEIVTRLADGLVTSQVTRTTPLN